MINQIQTFNYVHNKQIANSNQTVSFKGINIGNLPEIEVLEGVSPKFVETVVEAIKSYPAALTDKIYLYDFKVVLAKEIKDGLEHCKWYTDIKKDNPEYNNLLGLTYYSGSFPFTESNPNGNFIFLADKVKEASKLVNHECSHATLLIDKLERNQDFQQAVKSDIEELAKKMQQNLLPNQKRLIEQIFLNENKDEAFREIVADTLAWGCPGGGAYGSLLYDKNRDDYLMKKLFPNLISTINKHYGEKGLVYTVY